VHCTARHTALQATQELLDDTLLMKPRYGNDAGSALPFASTVHCYITKKRCTFQSAEKIDESAKLSW
jgi:hypothetical protein